jgi:lipopolysaccharide export LptBFGC system permease protein LptF
MREFLGDVFEPNRYNVATAVVVVGLLVFAYVVVQRPLVQYSVWLVIFTIWMAWFIYVGVDYFYGTED